jgi:hypothetical protein
VLELRDDGLLEGLIENMYGFLFGIEDRSMRLGESFSAQDLVGV